MKILALLCVPFLAIAACAPTADSYTHSGFQTPSNAGAIGTSLAVTYRRGSDITTTGEGYAYAIGSGDNGHLYGYSGVLPATSIPAPLTAGSATFNGAYEVAGITNIDLSGGFITGSTYVVRNGLSLTANFDTGTLTGGNANLSVIGTFSGATLTGSVNYLGLNGALTGLVGSTGAVGAFHGNSATDIYAGGFIVGTP